MPTNGYRTRVKGKPSGKYIVRGRKRGKHTEGRWAMGRSLKKGPFVDPKLIKRIEDMNAANEKRIVRTWSRSSTIFPEMVGHTIAIHDGRKHVPVFISESMVGSQAG